MSATTGLLEKIGARICGGENKKAFNLLYKGVDKVDVEKFHVKCDAKGPTVTILYGKHNTLFGGYTSQDWSSNKKRTKKDENAFLFYKQDSVNAECIFLPIIKEKADKAITCDANFGPTFGGGIFPWQDYDLQAFKKDKKPEYESKNGYLDLNGSLNVPCAYDVATCTQRSTDKEHLPSEKSDKANSKDINSGTMLVERIEVYQVVDDELHTPWKTKLEDDDCRRYRNELIQKEPLPGLDINYYNILLIGVIGSGKSSFFNTLATVFSGKVVPYAPARNASASVTNKLKAYYIVPDEGETLKIRIFDIRGFEDERGYGHELELILDGKIQSGYQFPEKPPPPKEMKEAPATMNNKIHFVCFVTGISNFETITSKLRSRFEAVKNTVAKKVKTPTAVTADVSEPKHLIHIRKPYSNVGHMVMSLSSRGRHATESIFTPGHHAKVVIFVGGSLAFPAELKIGLPMAVVATKFDEICPKISENVDHLYFSPKAVFAARQISDFFGIPLKYIYPVVNYVNESERSKGKDRLALQAIYGMLQLTEAYVQKHEANAKIGDGWAERATLLPSMGNANEKEIILMQLHQDISEVWDKKLRVLLAGPTRSGKSSFIDSVSSALRDDIIINAAGGLSSSTAPVGVSSTEKMYPIKYKHESGRIKSSNVYFGDTPGFQEGEGITVEHVRYILKGHVPNKYEIKNGIEKNSRGFKSRPPKADKIHCVCFVFDCKTLIEGLSYKIESTMRKVIDIVSKEGIPYIVILTKGDEDNKAVQVAKRRVFESKCVKDCKDKLMDMFMFRQNIIFPMVNYVHENAVDLQTDALLIAAFREILKKGKEYLEESDDEDEDDYSDATE